MRPGNSNIHKMPSAGQTPSPIPRDDYTIHRRGRFWAVLDTSGALVCITVYKCGAEEVVRRLIFRRRSLARVIGEPSSRSAARTG